MKNVFCVMIFAVALLASCRRHTDDIIISYIKDNKCDVLDLQDALNIKYDSMYLFVEFSNSKIPEIIGNNYFNKHEIVDSYDRILLFNNGEIVYEDDFPLNKMCFYEITERLDVVNSFYTVHYGTSYRVKKSNNGYDTYYTLILEKSKFTQYQNIRLENGENYYIVYDK